MLGYQSRIRQGIISTTGSAIVLTSAYADNISNVLPIGGAAKVTVYVSYTLAAGETNNNILLRIDTSHDSSTMYQLLNESVSGGTSTLTQREFTFQGATSVATSYNLALPLDVSDNFIRVAIRETGNSPAYGTAHAWILICGDK